MKPNRWTHFHSSRTDVTTIHLEWQSLPSEASLHFQDTMGSSTHWQTWRSKFQTSHFLTKSCYHMAFPFLSHTLPSTRHPSVSALTTTRAVQPSTRPACTAQDDGLSASLTLFPIQRKETFDADKKTCPPTPTPHPIQTTGDQWSLRSLSCSLITNFTKEEVRRVRVTVHGKGCALPEKGQEGTLPFCMRPLSTVEARPGSLSSSNLGEVFGWRLIRGQKETPQADPRHPFSRIPISNPCCLCSAGSSPS